MREASKLVSAPHPIVLDDEIAITNGLEAAFGDALKTQRTGSITLREALLRTAALASASMSLAAPLTSIAATLNKSAHSEEIDGEFQARVSAREIPGVVAMAANQQSVIYEGAFGFRDTATASRMSNDTIFRVASMVKLLTSVAALQLVERGERVRSIK
jgi:methyl acetate hydrolase